MGLFFFTMVFGQDTVKSSHRNLFTINEINFNIKSRASIQSIFDFSISEIKGISQYFQNPSDVDAYFNQLNIKQISYDFPELFKQYEFQLGIRINNKKTGKINDRISVRLGFSYTQTSQRLTSRGKFEGFESNPIYENANTYVISDSTNYSKLTVNHISNTLVILPSFQIYTTSKNQIQLFSGISIGLGLSLKNQLGLFYTNQIYTSSRTYIDNVLKTEFNQDNIVKNENIQMDGKLGNQFTSILTVPLGIRFRIGVSNKFWKRVHFQIESRPTLLVSYLNPEQKQTYRFISFHSGIAYQFKY